ncbi:hypothetical protein HY837_05785 [archaeon]|nr:hypothetical protein [archaeon]
MNKNLLNTKKGSENQKFSGLFLPKAKKGDLSFQTIVIAALCLIALIVLATASSDLINKFVKKLFGLGDEAQPEKLKKSCTYNGGYCTNLDGCKNAIIPRPSEGWEGSCEICCKL